MKTLVLRTRSKRIIAGILAVEMAFSVMPVYADDDITEDPVSVSADENISADTLEDEAAAISTEREVLAVNKVTETDSSITISWSGGIDDVVSYYEVYCNGKTVQSGIVDTSCVLSDLTPGSEYSVSVAAFDINGNILESSDVIYLHTDWIITSDTVLTSNKTVSDLNIKSGTLNLNGYTLTVKGDTYLSGDTGTSYLNVNRGKLYADGNFYIQRTNGDKGYGYLTMVNSDDYICINGDFIVHTYYANNDLTDGVIEVKGDFTQKYSSGYSNNFAPSGNHKVILSGEGLQTVSFDRTESNFNILEIQNFSNDGVVFSTPVTINTLIDNGCNVRFANGERSGWILEADETIEGDLFLSRGTLDLNGHKLTITGNLVHSGGTVLVNGGELEVQGDYRIQSLSGSTYGNSAGILNMTNEADAVKVFGDFVMQSTVSHKDKLTAGTLEVDGDLTQLSGGSYYNFYTSGTHTVTLNGTEKQTVSIYNNSKDYSRINNLKIANTSADGVDFARNVYVVGDLYNTSSVITNVTNLYIASTAKFSDGKWNNDINFVESYLLNDDLTVGGNVYLTGGTFKPNGHKLFIDGDFNMSSTNGSNGYGYINMSNTEDYICVNGDFLAYSYYASTLTDGIIEVKGDFTQRKYYYGYSNNFAPSGNHKVILSGESLQTVSFDRTESNFNILEIQNFSDDGVVFSTPVTINTLIDNGCNVSFANGERSGWTLEADETIEGDLFLSRGTLDLNGHKLTITGNLVHSGGTVLVNGGELEVQSDYRVQSLNGTSYTNSTGILNMTNEADAVKVFGDFVMQSTVSHKDKLTAGTLEVDGDLTQLSGGSYYNFYTSGTHTIILNGTEKQTVSIYNNSKDYSRINNLKIANTSADGVDFARYVYVVGNLYNTDSIIINATNLYISTTTVFADKVWDNNVNFAENYTLTDDISIGGSVYLTDGTLKLNGHKLLVDGNFNMSRVNGNHCYCYLNMTNPDDYICVNGDFLAYSYYANTALTEGVLEIKGDFTQKYYNHTNNFAPSGNHKVMLSGESLQTVSFDRTESNFNILEIQNFSDDGVVFSTPVTINTLIDNGCNVRFANGERSGWILEADETIEGDLFLSRGTLDLNGHKLTITGNLVHSGGTVLVNGGELEVQGDYRIQSLSGSTYGNSAGILNMTNEADTVKVLGSFAMQSTVSHKDKLTAGTLEVGGDLTQLSDGSYYNFYTSGTHTIILNGAAKQTVNIANNSKDYSRINNLKIANMSADGVDFARYVYVVGELYNSSSAITNVTNLYIASTAKFSDGKWNNDINFVESYSLNDDLTVGGNVYLTGGTFKPNGHKLLVEGDFNMSSTNGSNGYGYINMSNTEDYICVNGDFTVHTYYAYSNLTDGVIEVKGDFTQRKYYYGYSNNFAPSGNHKVILSGESLQTVSFDRTESNFNILEIQNFSDDGVVFSTPVTINTLIDNGCNVSFANGERSGWTLEADETIEGDLFLSRGILDLNGYKLTITGNLVHSGGTVLVNGGELEVQGDYRVQSLNGSEYTNSSGVLNMTNEADTVKVLGSFAMQSTVSHKDKLTAGTLEVGGDLTQLSDGSYYNFYTSGTHTIILNGAAKQTVNIANNSKDYSRINNLKIANMSADGVDFARNVYVVGELYNSSSAITNVTNLYIASTAKFSDGKWNNDINFVESYLLNDDLTVGGNVYLTGGTFKPNGHKLFIDGDFNMSSTNGSNGYGYINMSNTEDYICVNGDFLAYSYYASTLTDGIIEVKGDFTQRKYNYGYSNNFAPSGNHKVILNGTGVQKVNFATEQSGFNILQITKPIDTGYIFSRTPLWNELVESYEDTELPTAPGNLTFVRSNSSSIIISWDKSTDNYGIFCYKIYRNGEFVGQTSDLQYIDSGLSSHTVYEYYVIAVDTAGNLSEQSNILEAETDVDAFAPTQPKNLSADIRSEGVVRLSWTASSDNGTVVKYNIYRNGSLIGTSNGTAYTDSAVAAGLYEYYVEAVDNEGNVSRASDIVTIDNLSPTAPVLTINTVSDTFISLSWECSDNAGIVKYDVYRNGLKYKTVDRNVFVDMDIELDRSYSYSVIAYDAAGNTSAMSNEVSAYTGEDTESPVVSGISGTINSKNKRTVINVKANDNCGVSKVYLQYSTDNIAWENLMEQGAANRANESIDIGVDTSSFADGKVYFRAIAEDTAGNNSRAEESPIFSIDVDNTAPEIPINVSCSNDNGIVELAWESGSDDTEYFNIYRKSDNEDTYTMVKENYQCLNYFDSNIELGTEYMYYVTAVDDMYNESAGSPAVSGGIDSDNIKPQILSVYPDDSILKTNQVIGISAKDNFKLESIKVECRKKDGEWKTVFEENALDIYGKTFQFVLDTSAFTTGEYELKVTVTDQAGNTSEPVVKSYTYKECVLSSPIVTAEGKGWRNELNWTTENIEDLVGYRVYRKSSVSAEFSLIASITDSYYTDENLTPGKTYYYMIEAADSRNNYVKSDTVTAVPTEDDDIKPTADAGADVMGFENEPIKFSASKSYDNHYISEYHWDFGDGNTSDSAGISHTYEKEGTYNVELTVTDSAGNTDTHEIKAYVYGSEYNEVEFIISDEENRTYVDGVRVYCDIPGMDTSEFMSDSSGKFRLIAPKGTYDIYFYKNGYLPQYVQVTVGDDKQTKEVSIEKKELVKGKLTVEALDINEIVALGIDVTAPENQFVYQYELDYGKNGVLKFKVNALGDIIGEVNGKIQTERDGVYTTVATIKGEKDRAVSTEYGGYGNGGGVPVSVAVFNVTTEISWLKEFFDVDLTITNNASDDFYIDNSKAVLSLPSGLSLAGTSRGEDLVQIMGDNGRIGGKEEKSASWIIRGDKPGSYDLSAEFTGVLMPLGESVKTVFKTESPLVVHDGTGLKLDITVTEGLDYWTNQFTFTNNSDRPIYNFAASFSGSSQLAEFSTMYIKYPDGTIEIANINKGVPDLENSDVFLPALLDKDAETVYDHRTINPNETVTGYFSIYRRDEFTNDN